MIGHKVTEGSCRGQIGRQTDTVGRVDLREVIENHGRGPPVDDDVVRGEYQSMTVGRLAEDFSAPQGSGPQIERCVCFTVHDGRDRRLAVSGPERHEVGQCQRDLHLGQDALRFVHQIDADAQCLVPTHHLRQCGVQRLHRQLALQRQHETLVVRAVRVIAHQRRRADLTLRLGQGEVILELGERVEVHGFVVSHDVTAVRPVCVGAQRLRVVCVRGPWRRRCP